jgi:hypothetical protein
MIKYMVSFLLLANVMFAENAIVEEEKTIEVTQVYNPNVDCLILEDENSIICKFEVIRDTKDQQIVINWVSPTGEISRTREMNIPAGDVQLMIIDILMVEKVVNGILKSFITKMNIVLLLN